MSMSDRRNVKSIASLLRKNMGARAFEPVKASTCLGVGVMPRLSLGACKAHFRSWAVKGITFIEWRDDCEECDLLARLAESLFESHHV